MGDDNVEVAERSVSVLVLGASGRLGARLVQESASPKIFKVISHSRKSSDGVNADLTMRDETFNMLDLVNPSVIINTVALAEIEGCEKNPNRTFKTNVLSVQNVVDWIKSRGNSCHLVHISTDHVYDGDGPHVEDELVITNYYSFSKFASEIVARQVPSTVLRTNFVGKSVSGLRQTFSDFVVNNLRQNRRIELVNDIWFSPVSLNDLTSAIFFACSRRLNLTANVGARGSVTKYEFGLRVASGLGLNIEKIDCVAAKDCLSYMTYRPRNMVMDSRLWESVTGLQCPSIDEVINSVISEYK